MAGKNKFTSLQTIRAWTCEDVQRALTKHDLKECCAAIAKRSIDGEALLNLTEGKLALWKQDLKNAEIQKLSTFVVNINFYPEKYSSSAEVRGLSGGSAPARTWGQPTPTPTPPLGKPTSGVKSSGSSNGFNAPATPPTPNKFNKPNVASNFNKPNLPSNFNKPNPPITFNKPNLPSNFNKPNPPGTFNKPSSAFNKSTVPNNFIKPSPEGNATRPAPNASRLYSPGGGGGGRPTPPQSLRVNQTPPNEYLPMGRKSPLPTATPVLAPTNQFTKPPPNKKPLPAPPRDSFYPPPESPPSEYPEDDDDDDDDQPEYLNVDSPESHPAANPQVDDGHHSDGSWGTDFDDTEQDDFDLPPPPEVPSANKSSLFSSAGTPSLPQRPPNREPALPARPTFQPVSTFGYPQPPAAIDNNLLNGLIGEDVAEYADDEEYSLIDEYSHQPTPPALAPREYLQKPTPLVVPEARAPGVPHREPVVILPRNPGQFGGGRMPDGHAQTPKLPPREPYLNRFPRFPTPQESYPSQEAEDDSEYEVIEHREGDDDYLAPTGMNHAVSAESVASSASGGLAEKLRETLHARKISLTMQRPETPPLPLDYRVASQRVSNPSPTSLHPLLCAPSRQCTHVMDRPEVVLTTFQQTATVRRTCSSVNNAARRTLFNSFPPAPKKISFLFSNKTPTLESKPLPKAPAFDRQFSTSQPQRPLPPPPEPVRRPSGGSASGGGATSLNAASLKTKQWYHDVDRRRGEEMLRNGEDGSFLLRPSARTENPLTLTLWHEGRIYNIGVRLRKDQRYALGTEKAMERSFGSVDELVAFYQRDLLMLYSGGEKTGSTYLTETPGRRYMSH